MLFKEKPDYVLVYGDTNSTLAGALAAEKLHTTVAHIEAGLRSFNRCMPKEVNRVLTDHAPDILFAPTQTPVENLQREGISEEQIQLAGDVMYDAALYYGKKAEYQSQILNRLELKPRGYILATIHPAENTDGSPRLCAIIEGFIEVAQEIKVVLPHHPRTRAALVQVGLYDKVARSICLIEPIGYLDMLMLDKNARLIATDSGGVQKESFFYRVPCLTLREETEWIELINLGWHYIILPFSADVVADAIKSSLKHFKGVEGGPYRDGKVL